MKITVLTVCPDLFRSFLESHEVKRAVSRGNAEVEIVDIRAFASGSYRNIDDSPFGGGRGMVLRPGPVLDALAAVKKGAASGPECTAVFSPAGKRFGQETARRYAGLAHLILICGHYEGLDERIMKAADEAVSLGDFILTGGEIPAMAVADAVLRLLKGNLKEGSAEEESFEDGLLEYPQYTQPADFRGDCVPEVLRSGDHGKIRAWRRKEALLRTALHRPDLLKDRGLTEEERGILEAAGLDTEAFQGRKRSG